MPSSGARLAYHTIHCEPTTLLPAVSTTPNGNSWNPCCCHPNRRMTRQRPGREIVNAIGYIYIRHTGAAWRMLPYDLPSCRIVFSLLPYLAPEWHPAAG